MRIQNLKVEYDGHLALEVADAVFAQRGITAILGPNGSGKSTLLKAMAVSYTQLSARLMISS